ncbi:hypothetical protein FS815_21705 [Agrobacterium vitis]|uniref:hypothetical protein n=1 Tax=Allorhizobium ampelinum TaxID=3025782 RepID=UPI001F17002F|nr:hypothetical protein [Allorhizobium ampelinum]MCF1449408.1 hypothetical protein [Allorhizobium ampelinum]
MSTDPETRRAIAHRAINRAKSRGMPIDEGPIFMALLDAWISGDIDMRTMRERYLDSFSLKEEQHRGRQPGQNEISLDDNVQEKRADGVNRGP